MNNFHLENSNADFGVEEKLWFEIQQPLLLWMCQHKEGRKLLCMDQTLERIDIIRPNSVSMYLGDGMMKTDFRTHSKWAKLIRSHWTQFQDIADEYAFLMNLGEVEFISEPVVPMAATTSTFYPAAGANSPVDGYVNHNGSGTWSSIRDGVGTGSDDTSATMWLTYIGSDGTSNVWSFIYRGIALFDTSSLGSDTIDSTTLSVYYQFKSNNFAGAEPEINVYSSAPASNSTLASGDYDSLGTTAFSTNITYTNFNSGYEDFEFNASGLAAVDGGGISKFGIRDAIYDAANTAPTWGANDVMRMRCYAADQSGTTNDPKLVVDHTAAASTFTPRAIMF